MLTHLKCTTKHIYLYIYEDSLLVWSIHSKQLYGFQSYSAALFLFMEELKGTAGEDMNQVVSFVKESGYELSNEIKSTIENINKLLNGIEVIDELSEEDPILFSERLTTQLFKTKEYYKLYDNYFSLNINDKDICESLLEAFSHLSCSKPKEEIALVISIVSTEQLFELYVNQKKVQEIVNIRHVLPSLHDIIRSEYYQKSDFLVAMHAGSLKYNEKMLILPGVSGAGKSTLCTFLMQEEFELFSDELTLIDSKHAILPLPLCVTLKEGSWNTVQQFVPELVTQKSHLRFDGQNIKVLSPKNIVKKSCSAKVGTIIFPTYKKEIKNELKEIGLIETLQRITETQYHIVDTQDIEKVESWLTLLTSCHFYLLSYSNLNEAKEQIKKVMNK